MKNRFFIFIKKYVFLFIADMVLMVGLLLTKIIWGNEDILGIDMMHWSASSLYLLYTTLAYPFLHGIISYLIYKKIWIPNAILFFVTWIANCLINLEFRLSSIFSFEWLTWPSILFVISTVFSLITSFVVKAIKDFKLR